jgi:hypothetical protein
MDKELPRSGSDRTEWDKQRNTANNLWVIAVFGFWITIAILAIVYFLKDELNLVLVSIALGMMILGVWLKTRYQLMLRRGPQSPGHGEDHSTGV